MAGAGNKKDVWLPSSMALSAKSKVVRPFQQLQEQVRKLGFEAFLRHDQRERTIEVEFRPTNEKTAQAVKVAAQSSQVNALRIAAQYDHGDSPGEKALQCIERGVAEIREIL